MPYTTIVAGTTITAAWANANVRDQVVTPFASSAALTSAISAPVEGMQAYVQDVDQVWVYNGTSWLSITPKSANVATSEATATASYVDLATTGPSVSLQTGTKALITLCCYVTNATTANNGNMGVAISGATTLAASDVNAAGPVSVITAANVPISRTFQISGLTAGVNTFKAQYKPVNATSLTFTNRDITVVGIP